MGQTYKRIAIIGPSGSGKTTLAVKLGQFLKLPVYHTDKYPRETVCEEIDKVASTDEWIIDGIVTGTLERRLERAELVIYLNYPIEFCKLNIVKRHELREVRVDNPENPQLSAEEFMLYCLRAAEKFHPQNDEKIAKHKDKTLEFITREQLNDWLKSFLMVL